MEQRCFCLEVSASSLAPGLFLSSMEKLNQIYSRPTELLSFQSTATHMLCSSLHHLATHNIWLFGFFWNYFCWHRRRCTYLLPRFYLKHKLLVINFCVIKRHWQYIQHPSTSPTPTFTHLAFWQTLYSDLHWFLGYTANLMHSLEIKPMILALLAPCSTVCHLFFYSFLLRINILVFMNSVVRESI